MSRQWWGIPRISAFVIFPVPMSMPRKICRESADTTSPEKRSAKVSESAVFQEAVGP